jgi:myo-inositol-1(or 4)-monophosphatase
MNTTYTNFITDVLEQSSEIALSYFGEVSGTTKEGDNNQVLTQADLEIGQFIIAKIKEVYPDHNVIDEEAGVVDNNSEYTWVVDPIDGTSNFASGVPLYGIMIGLLREGVPVAGGIALPYFHEIYSAAKGSGAYCNGEKISVTTEMKLLHSLVAYSIDGHQDDPQFTQDECLALSQIILKIRNLRDTGSCFDAAMVAKGKFGAYLNRTGKIWDNVAQQIIIEEAGGVYTDFFGKPMDYSHPLTKAKDNFTFCTGAPTLHQQLQEIIQAIK